MSIALRNCVPTLFRKYRHQLLKRSTWFTYFKLNLNSITVDEVRREWSVVEGVIPAPANTSFVIVEEHPLQAFNIRLTNSFRKLVLVHF